MNNKAKRFAVVRIWADNPNNLQVIEYVETIEEGDRLIAALKREERKRNIQYNIGNRFEVMRYE